MLINSLSSQLPSQVKSSEPLGSKQPLASDQDLPLKKSPSDEEGESDNKKLSAQKSFAEQRVLQKLKIRDREVRAHELAHMVAGGRYITSGAQFSYEKGPDGKLYAVAGEVGIDTSKVPGDPRATLLKAQIVARAALAPADPSPQDRNVAAQAAVLIQQARIELAALLADTSANDSGQNIDAFA
ncbi:MAG: hypothetical protein GY744_08750 [Gammaproteobacteria bacterium]|nr:hypothetical protein [Gammaproteobacteria bacterium]